MERVALEMVIVWLVEVKPLGPVQLKVKGAVPVGLTVKVAEPPGQVLFVAGVTVQVGGGAMLIWMGVWPDVWLVIGGQKYAIVP